MKFTDHHHEQLLRAAAEVWPSRAVHPGDSGTRNLADAEAIRAYNHEWSIRLPWADIEGVEV